MSGAQYYTQDTFLKPDDKKAFHGFFTRKGGLSSGDYAALNCGVGSGDEQGVIAQNRALVAEKAGVAAHCLLALYQCHGKDCITVKGPWGIEDRPKADSCVTDQPGIGLGILTADCAPVLFYGEKADGAPVIGAAHAGWKGALGGVLTETLHGMDALGAEKASIRACVGPCISKGSYEVSADFVEPFLEEHDESVRFFHAAPREHHMMFDLAGYCAWRLFREGVRQIALMDKDTYAHEADFFSYRRMTHRGEKDYGRQISVIAIKASSD